MKWILIIVLILPLAALAQPVLTGSWRLKESQIINGPDYTNALPLVINIWQKPNVIILESTLNNGETDTLVKESIAYDSKSINESITKTGKKKIVTFRRGMDDNCWIKQTNIFTKEDSHKLQSVNKESFRLRPDGNALHLLREYSGNNDPHGNEDFVIDGTYEKVMPEQLDKERATGKGVKFAEGLSWERIKAKAQKENKYIFVDCYATWCRPCKMMDKYVYPINNVGEAMNGQFIAVKVQMDTTKNDASYIKMLYPLARKLETEYNISVLPTYLFFSPDGKIVHKAVGQMDTKKFIELLSVVRNPEHQLYTLVNKAKKMELPWGDYPGLATRLKEKFKEKELAIEVASIYYRQYLNKLSEKELLTKINLDFIGQYPGLVKSSDNIFEVCHRQPVLVDSIKEYKGEGWAESIVERTIKREEIDASLQEAEKTSKEPDWKRLNAKLTKKYGNELATTYVLGERVSWYWKKQEWASFLQYVRPYLARLDLKKINAEYLHWCAWFVFKYSDDTTLMKEALGWVDMLIEKWPQEGVWAVMDTKACLLYKIGKKEEGIAIMKKLTQTFPQFNYSFQPRLEKMNKGEDIWLTFR